MRSWLLAFRPKTLTAAIVPVIAATCLVYAEGLQPKLWITAFALLSATFIQIGTNFINDAIDFRKGADTKERIGPQRVTQSGLLTEKQVLFGGFACFAIAAAFGLPLVIEGGIPILIVGLISLVMGYCYTGGPYPLAYRGLGDLFVLIFFGLVAVGGTYYLHAGQLSNSAIVAGIQVGLHATVLIAINNLRDAPLDAKVNKRTLAVRLGPKAARAEIVFLVIAPFLLGYWWVANSFLLLLATLLPVLTAPLAVIIIRGIYKNSGGAVYNQFLAKSAALHLVFGFLLSIGLLLSDK
jgi:1,4-dihydroxy-2-naphthoate polyprenyltransferase